MKRSHLEQIIRASGAIAEDDEIVIIGSQAILGQYPDAPQALLVSVEADVFPKNHPERADLIDGSIGEASPFQQSFGYYAHGVSPETAKLPAGWQERLVPIRNQNTRDITGWCLEAHDLAISKYVAGREKDLVFTADLVAAGFVREDVLNERLATTQLVPEVRDLVQARIRRDFRPA